MFDRVDLSVRHKTKQNRVVMVMNPSHKDHFIYKRFFERGAFPTRSTELLTTLRIFTHLSG